LARQQAMLEVQRLDGEAAEASCKVVMEFWEKEFVMHFRAEWDTQAEEKS
jgi:hypothetical protein